MLCFHLKWFEKWVRLRNCQVLEELHSGTLGVTKNTLRLHIKSVPLALTLVLCCPGLVMLPLTFWKTMLLQSEMHSIAHYQGSVSQTWPCWWKIVTDRLPVQGWIQQPLQLLTFNIAWKEFRMQIRNEASGKIKQNRASDS